jgi:hypothetical protein
MEQYRNWSPTAFDPKGLNGDANDVSDWYVVPCIRTRDSRELEASNFETALEMLGGEGQDVQVHRFGHWGPGWFEIILVRPECKAYVEAVDIESNLEDYPVLDEEDYSRREYEAAADLWESSDVGDRVHYIKRHGCGEHVSIFAARRSELPSLDYSGMLN